MRLDIYNHIFPSEFVARLDAIGVNKAALARMKSFAALCDVNARLRLMDRFDDYAQVLSLSGPPIEFFGSAQESPALARLANDAMAAICRRHPDRFPGFVASLPMNNPEAAVAEIDRATGELSAVGAQIFSNVNGRPLDDPAFFPVFERAAALDVPLWLHPDRSAGMSDYAAECKSKYEIWFVFGWPYETSAAMARLVFSGLFDRLPGIKIICHHMGAMIPFFEGRIGPGYDELGTRTGDEDYAPLLAAMSAKGRRPVDYFRMFYGDTAVNGAAGAIQCGLGFFGNDRCLFATDFPFDPEGGAQFVRETIAAIDRLGLDPASEAALYEGNARRLLRLGK
ncbi:MAG: amidohydrolase family protein [Alphaproteobacteria bacterium]